MAHEIAKEWTTKAGLKAYVLYVNNSHHCGYVEAPEDLMSGEFTLTTFYKQLEASKKMGPLPKVMEI